MSKPLVIVESPAKARTIAGYLGPSYVVESSIGHIRDLPSSSKDQQELEQLYKSGAPPWVRQNDRSVPRRAAPFARTRAR